jgi:hypothetical protein
LPAPRMRETIDIDYWAMGKSSPMQPSRDINFPVAIMATVALALLSVVAIRMMWLGIYAAFWID